MITRQEFEPARRTTTGWLGPKDQQNKMVYFLSFCGVMYVIVNSRKDKGKALKEKILKDIVPRDFDARFEKFQEGYYQQNTQLQQAIHE